MWADENIILKRFLKGTHYSSKNNAVEDFKTIVKAVQNDKYISNDTKITYLKALQQLKRMHDAQMEEFAHKPIPCNDQECPFQNSDGIKSFFDYSFAVLESILVAKDYKSIDEVLDTFDTVARVIGGDPFVSSDVRESYKEAQKKICTLSFEEMNEIITDIRSFDDEDSLKTASDSKEELDNGEDDFFTGCQFYRRGQYQLAIPYFQSAGNKGNRSAQFYLGFCYSVGQGVEKDCKESAKWYRLSAEQGDSSAQNNLGICYEKGEGVEQNYHEAMKWYRLAAESGDVNAINHMGDCYYSGKGVGIDYQKALQYYETAQDKGSDKRADIIRYIKESLSRKQRESEKKTWQSQDYGYDPGYSNDQKLSDEEMRKLNMEICLGFYNPSAIRNNPFLSDDQKEQMLVFNKVHGDSGHPIWDHVISDYDLSDLESLAYDPSDYDFSDI
ncbi:MAG: sel1 repeat family protein [Ruminococcus sp.]|nr:sel1 repeat family protein [Candidatus Apopatosoma intestinale]